MKVISKLFLFLIILNSFNLMALYPSENFTMLSQYMPMSETAFDVAFKNDTCFLINDEELEILDVSNPQEPYLLNRLDDISGRKLKIAKINDEFYFAFIKPVNSSTPGIILLNVSDIYNIPSDTLLFQQEVISAFEIMDNYFIITVDTLMQIYQMTIVDNKLNISFISQVSTFNRNYSLTIDGIYIYLGQQNGIGIVDITDIENPVLINEFSNYEDPCPFDMKIDNSLVYNHFLYAAGCVGMLFIFDISDPINPVLMEWYAWMWDRITSLSIHDNYLYFTELPNQGGLYMLDIIQPISPVFVGNFKNIPKPGGMSVKVHNGLVYYCGLQNTEGYPLNQQGGLFILKNDLITTVDKNDNFPTDYLLSQNYPNPFNPSTKIEYSIPQTSQVQIKVFDLLGNEIATLVNEEKSSGEYEVEFNGTKLPSGVYFYQLKAGSYSEIKKMVLMK